METKIIGLASDHAGFALKQFVKSYLEEKGYEYKDYGTYTEDSCDYSDFGHALARGIEAGEVYPGIAICGSGEGINMTLNKHQTIRAGLCWILRLPISYASTTMPTCSSCRDASSTTTWHGASWTSSLQRSSRVDATRSA